MNITAMQYGMSDSAVDLDIFFTFTVIAAIHT